jgi:putative AdoMet-dependent methyltransferase
MESQYGAAFNHDPWADGYDQDVRNEAQPIRAGYAEVLAWTVAQAQITPQSVVLDLGSGTGNTSALIPAARRVVCVDLSARMTELARPKLAHLARVEFVMADLLGYFHTIRSSEQPPQFDAVLSTYAVHHLTEDEKTRLFRHIWERLRPGGRAVFGDLMFAHAEARRESEEKYRLLGDQEMIESFDEEFFWLVDAAEAALAAANFELVETRRFSELSWGICARKPVS